MNILNPPKSYVNLRCELHDPGSVEAKKSIREKFFKDNPGSKEEIGEFVEYLDNARGDGTMPIERIEVREADGTKHGNILPMMIYDIEHWIQGDKIKMRKLYTYV
jgi:hypothetical protein